MSKSQLKTISIIKNRIAEMASIDRHKFELTVCLSVGIIFGCITQALYGSKSEWAGLPEGYCTGFLSAFLAVAPVTLGYTAGIFACAPFSIARMLIYPGAAIRGMGLGALFCGAMQCGSLREMCFDAIVMLPYAAANCVLAVYAGEYALGLKESFTSENEGLTGSLVLHTIKMLSFYLAVAALSCVAFAASCLLFGKYLI